MVSHISTSRLVLVPATVKIVEAELAGRAALSSAIGADVPDDWPPPLNDDQAFRVVMDRLRSVPGDVGWWFWYVLRTGREADAPAAIGICGFKGRPTAEGVAEIGYSVMPECHRKGFANEACEALLDWAFSHEEVAKVIGHTLEGLTPSIGVMEKLGFIYEGEGPSEEAPTPQDKVVRYGLCRSEHEAAIGRRAP